MLFQNSFNDLSSSYSIQHQFGFRTCFWSVMERHVESVMDLHSDPRTTPTVPFRVVLWERAISYGDDP